MTPIGEKVGWHNLTWDDVTWDAFSTKSPEVSTCRTANMSDIVESWSEEKDRTKTIWILQYLVRRNGLKSFLFIHRNNIHHSCMSSYLSSVADALPPSFHLWLWCPVAVLLACSPCMKASPCAHPMSWSGIWSWSSSYKPSAGKRRCTHSDLLQTEGLFCESGNKWLH